MFSFDGSTRRRVYRGPGRFLAVNAAMRSCAAAPLRSAAHHVAVSSPDCPARSAASAMAGVWHGGPAAELPPDFKLMHYPASRLASLACVRVVGSVSTYIVVF